MSEDQLKSIAESLEIKGARKMDRAALGFAILDKEAVIESQKPSEPKPAAKKRGRPKKEEKAAAPKEAAKAPKETKETAAPKEEKQADAAQPQPKKRGRKAKAAPAEEAAPADPAAAAAEAPAEAAVAEAPAEAPKAGEVDSKQFIHNLFDDLRDDEAQQEEIQEQKKSKKKNKGQQQGRSSWPYALFSWAEAGAGALQQQAFPPSPPFPLPEVFHPFP